MSNIPSLHYDLLKAAQQLQFTAEQIAQTDWKDGVRCKFYDEYVNHYIHVVNMLVYGNDNGERIYNLGMNDIFKSMDQYVTEMEKLVGYGWTFQYTGELLDSYANPINPVYNDRMELEPWDTKYNGPRPGEMTDDDVKRLLSR